jgi:hypothetical protein
LAKLIELTTFSDPRGSLSVLEDFNIPFNIKRIFYIYNLDKSTRAGHKHKRTYQALICIAGSCEVYNFDGTKKEIFRLDSPVKCLLLRPPDWHLLYDFSPGTILLVAASENFDEKDYIFERYENDPIS